MSQMFSINTKYVAIQFKADQAFSQITTDVVAPEPVSVQEALDIVQDKSGIPTANPATIPHI